MERNPPTAFSEIKSVYPRTLFSLHLYNIKKRKQKNTKSRNWVIFGAKICKIVSTMNIFYHGSELHRLISRVKLKLSCLQKILKPNSVRQKGNRNVDEVQNNSQGNVKCMRQKEMIRFLKSDWKYEAIPRKHKVHNHEKWMRIKRDDVAYSSKVLDIQECKRTMQPNPKVDRNLKKTNQPNSKVDKNIKKYLV